MDLRRLILWHGRSFTVRTSQHIRILMFKSNIWAFVILWFNLFNGYSSFLPIEDSLFVMYTVNLTVWAGAFYGFFDTDVSWFKYG